MAHRIAPLAESDLDGIWYYVARESGSIEIANRLIDSLTDRFFLMASSPYMGRIPPFEQSAKLHPFRRLSYCAQLVL
jgi:plasmid stabilization system protein ParE